MSGMLLGRSLLSLSLACACSTGNAQGLITVNEAWARVAANGRSAEAYMRVTSSQGAALVGARSRIATRVRIIGPGHPDGVAKLALPPRQQVDLARGHYRIRLDGLTGDTRLGALIPITLEMRRGDGSELEIPIYAEVRRHSPTEDETRPHHSHSQNHAH
jgi:copper(I)-binding protein